MDATTRPPQGGARLTRRSDELERKCKSAIEILEHLLAPSAGKGSHSVLVEILRRAEQPSGVDGYRTRTSLDPSGVGGGSELTSVEAAASSRMDDICSRCGGSGKGTGRGRCRGCAGSGRRWADPIALAAEALVKELYVLSRSAGVISSQTDAVMGSAARLAGRQSSLQGVCQVAACGATVSGVGSDRLRSGWCHRCFLHWSTWRLLNRTPDPGADRASFASYMETFLAQKAAKEEARAERESKELDRLRKRGELPTARAR